MSIHSCCSVLKNTWLSVSSTSHLPRTVVPTIAMTIKSPNQSAQEYHTCFDRQFYVTCLCGGIQYLKTCQYCVWLQFIELWCFFSARIVSIPSNTTLHRTYLFFVVIEEGTSNFDSSQEQDLSLPFTVWFQGIMYGMRMEEIVSLDLHSICCFHHQLTIC